jgi:NTP pyrophosphatase (non-canonical NTP hydrolase)
MLKTLNEYQELAKRTWSNTLQQQSESALYYVALGLGNEAGEVQGKIKKLIRDKNGVLMSEDAKEIALELGDALWYLSMIAAEIGVTLEEIAEMNIKKLESRKERGMIQGSGDYR